MSWIKHTGCRYHNQDTWYYCGAAAAMMVLAEIGVPYSDLDQDDLYTSNHNNSIPGWYTGPNGLEYTLNTRKPANFNGGFIVHKPTSYDEGNQKIIHTLYEYGVSPAVLIFGCGHWVVVPGVQTDVEPVPGAEYELEGFWIHNPVHHPGEPPPPHSATDACGSGGTLGTGNEFATENGWKTDYFTGCNYDDPAKQYISVCDPEIPKIKKPQVKGFIYRPLEKGLLSEQQAIEFSHEGLKKYRLLEDIRVAKAVEKAQPGNPQLVLRLDRPNVYYYLVPWNTRRNVTMLTARIDARFGTFYGIHIPEKGEERPFVARETIEERMAYKRVEIPRRKQRLVILPRVTQAAPTLVWQPCWESFSPYLPFYQYTIGKQTIYVRVDGEMFTELTTKGRGA